MTQQERFEAWVGNPGMLDKSNCHDNCGEYTHPWTRGAWEAWQAACPEGWQCVPIKPTKQMRDDFHDVNEAYEDACVGESPDSQWQAMLAAAPKPEDV